MDELAPFLWLAVTAAILFALLPFGPVHRWVRKTSLPMVVREDWSSREYRDHLRKTQEWDQPMSGSLNWQAHCELQRMSDAASTLSASLIDWRTQLAGLEAEASRLEQRAAAALAADDERKARLLLTDRRAVKGRSATLQEDIERSETTLDSYRREISALEDRLGTDLRRESLAQARIEGARNTIRARQLMHGTLAEAAMAKLEKKEQEATLAEAKVEALDLAATSSLVGELEKLELERDLDALRVRLPKAG